MSVPETISAASGAPDGDDSRRRRHDGPNADPAPGREARTWESGYGLGRRVLVAGSRRWGLSRRALARFDRSTGTGSQRRWDDLAEQLLASDAGTISVDVFDTVLVRRVVGDDASARLVGLELVRRGLWSAPVDAFVRARREAGRGLAYPSLVEIYGQAPLAAVPAELGAAVEGDVEADLVVPVPGAAPALDRLRRAGRQVMFVSDMHLSRPQLWSMLIRAGLAVEGDELLVSCERGACKTDGSLFAQLDRSDGVVHVGNNLWGDVAMAESAGVPAVPVTSAEASPLEQLMAARPASRGPVVAAAARQARLARPTSDPVADRAWDLGADVAGQCMVAFLLWVRQVCHAEEVADIAFLARDGELPLRMARAMPADHWDGTRLSYLHCSRRAWTLAAAACVGVERWLEVGTADESAYLHHSRHRQPFRALLDRVGLDPGVDLTHYADLAALDPDRPLPPEAADRWSELLWDARARERIADASEGRRRLVRDHLAGLGLLDGRVALVDVGWRGQLAWLVSALMRDATGAEPIHLHFGGYEPIEQPDDKVDIRRFAFDGIWVPAPVAAVVSCVETFTASGRERAVDFERRDGGEVVPVFARPVPEVGNATRASMWAGAEAVARAMPDRATLDSWELDAAPLDAEVRSILARFWERPDRSDARVAADLWFESDDVGEVVSPVAAPYRLTELLGRPDVPRHWRQASLTLSALPTRLAARAYFAAGKRGLIPRR